MFWTIYDILLVPSKFILLILAYPYCILNIFSMLTHWMILTFIIMTPIDLVSTSSILLFSKLFKKIFTTKMKPLS